MPLRVAFVLTYPQWGGAERIMANLAHGISHRWEPTLFLPDATLASTKYKERTPTVSYPGMSTGVIHSWLGLWRALKEFRPDLVHINLPGPFDADWTLYLLLGRFMRCPVLTLDHLTDIPTWRRMKLLKRITSSSVRRELAISQCGLEDLVAIHGLAPKRLEVLRLGVPDIEPAIASRRGALRDSLGLESDDCLILFLGRLAKQKQPDHLIRAFSAVRNPRLKLALVGDGPLRGEVESAIALYGLAGKVRCLGHSDEPSAWMAAADLLVLSSSTEGTPLVMMEAFAAGKPVVTYPFRAVEEMMTDGLEGRIVHPSTPEALAAVLDALAESPDIRREMGIAARLRYEQQFRLEDAVRRLEGIYDTVLAERAR